MAIFGGVILCGGKSQRMGQPKAWLPFGPERLLQRVVRKLGSVVDRLVVVAATGQDLPELPEQVEVVRDSAFQQGPLRGLATGLAALPESVDLVFVAATDVPFLEPAWYQALADEIGDNDLIVPRDESGRLHPLAAVYRRGPILTAAEKLLGMGSFRMSCLVDVTSSRVIDANVLRMVDPTLTTLENLNTPEQYHQALVAAGLLGW